MGSNQEELIARAVAKAIAGGWKPLVDGEVLGVSSNKFTKELHLTHKAPWNNGKWALGQSVSSVIYDHEFAKALWGEIEKEIFIDDAATSMEPQPFMGGLIEYPYNEGSGITFNTALWQYHLQQMVVADDPIAYLGENI